MTKFRKKRWWLKKQTVFAAAAVFLQKFVVSYYVEWGCGNQKTKSQKTREISGLAVIFQKRWQRIASSGCHTFTSQNS